MHHACAVKFNMMRNLEKFLKLNKCNNGMESDSKEKHCSHCGARAHSIKNQSVFSVLLFYFPTNRSRILFSALPMQDSITESKTINYILFMIFY